MTGRGAHAAELIIATTTEHLGSRPGGIGEGDVDRLITTTRALRSRDFSRGGGEVRPVAADHARRAGILLTATCTERVRRRLTRAVIGAYQLAGWTAFDAGHPLAAREHYRRALRLAGELNDPSLTAYLLYSTSRIDLDNGAPGAALATLRLASTTAESGDDPRLRCALNAHLVRAYAQLGQPEQAELALNRTREQFLLEADPGSWAAHFDESELWSTEGALYSYQPDADPHPAIDHYLRAMTLRSADQVRTGTFMRITLASLLLRVGELDIGLPMAHAAIDSCEHLTSRRAVRRLERLEAAAASRPTIETRELRARVNALARVG